MPTFRFGESVVVGDEQLAELGKRLVVAAHLLQRHDLAVADRQDRLDVQKVAGERGRASDAAALCQVLERVDGEEQAVLVAVALDERVDLLIGRAALEPRCTPSASSASDAETVRESMHAHLLVRPSPPRPARSRTCPERVDEI